MLDPDELVQIMVLKSLELNIGKTKCDQRIVQFTTPLHRFLMAFFGTWNTRLEILIEHFFTATDSFEVPRQVEARKCSPSEHYVVNSCSEEMHFKKAFIRFAHHS